MLHWLGVKVSILGETDGLARIDATFAHFENSLAPEEMNHGEEAGIIYDLSNRATWAEHFKDDIKSNRKFKNKTYHKKKQLLYMNSLRESTFYNAHSELMLKFPPKYHVLQLSLTTYP